jgi:TPR repeat protein
LGRCLAEGIGVEADTKEAVKWYRRAAEQDCLPAQFNLGRNLLEAHSPEAARWLELAATADHTEAQWLLGRALDDGVTLPRDATAAVK